jgi:protein-S-isoprenylcysteine O-methyltransferase Ste14
MAWRALLAFLALPGVVAFAVPLALVVRRHEFPPPRPAGFGPLALGVLLLLWCVRGFYVEGRGTLAPWAAPKRLVRGGPYRYCRNPMYVGVALILVGWAAVFRSRSLLIYAAGVTIAFHLRVVFGEEPWLARTFGEEWNRYRARTPRWLSRVAVRRDPGRPA